MTNLKHALLRVISVGLASGILITALAACSPRESETTMEVRQRFNQSLLDEDYNEAQRIYEKDSYEANFDSAVYIQMLKNRMDQLYDRYSNDLISYDQAVIQMQQMMFAPAIVDALEDHRLELLHEMNKQVAAVSRVSLANELNSRGAYREAIVMYQALMDEDPEASDLSRGLQQATNGYVSEIQEEVVSLRGNRFVDQALYLVHAALKILPGHQDLLNLETTLKEDQANLDLSLDTRRALIEIQQLMAQNDYEEALVRIRLTREDPSYADKIAELDELEEQIHTILVTDNLRRAGEVNADFDPESLHWETRPYEDALAIVREGLQVLPDHETLRQAEAHFTAVIPHNFREMARFNRGRQQSLPSGTEVFDYVYPDDRAIFNLPLYVIGATQLELDNRSDDDDAKLWDTLRLLISPETGNGRNYNNYELYIYGDGQTIASYTDNFNDLTAPLLYELSIGNYETIEIHLVRDSFLGWLGASGSEPFIIEGFVSNQGSAPALPELAQPQVEDDETEDGD